MSSPVGVIPADFFASRYKDQVIDFLRSRALPARERSAYLRGWAQHVDVELTREDFERVEQGAIG